MKLLRHSVGCTTLHHSQFNQSQFKFAKYSWYKYIDKIFVRHKQWGIKIYGTCCLHRNSTSILTHIARWNNSNWIATKESQFYGWSTNSISSWRQTELKSCYATWGRSYVTNQLQYYIGFFIYICFYAYIFSDSFHHRVLDYFP